MTDVCAIPAFRDNYIWLLVGEGAPPPVVIVDPGDAAPVLAALRHLDLRPTTLFITHHHSDHAGGVAALCDAFPLDVYGPANETIPRRRHALCDGDRVALPGLPAFTVLDVPGHTAYHGGGRLFCGDTLFAGGCGRLFEGTAAQMYASLGRLASLADNTIVYCAHEYTLSNLAFALAVEPENAELHARHRQVQTLRRRGAATVPSTKAVEKGTNPFQRCHIPKLAAAVSR